MGLKTPEILALLDVPYAILDADNLEPTVDHLLGTITQRCVPGALLVRPGVIQ
jgi:hypothetical protein